MLTITIATIALFGPLTGATIQDTADEAALEAYEGAIDAWQLAQKEHRKAYSEAETADERMRIWEEERPDADAFAPAFLEIAASYPGGKVALDSLGWVAGNAKDTKMIVHVCKEALRDHLASPDLGSFVDSIARSSDPAAERVLLTILTSSPHRDVKGKACYQLGMKKLSAARLARRVQEADEEDLDMLNRRYTEVAVMRAKGLEPKLLQIAGERLLERVVNEFGDVERWGRVLGKYAAAELFELRRLQLGMIVPEIEGVGIDEKPMKLSDYRGKVVLLDFWGDW